MRLELSDSRRLTGPNLYWDHPGAIADVVIDGVAPERVVAAWARHCRRLLDAVGWADAPLTHRRYEGGASLVFAAPIDALYAACEVNEAAVACAAAELAGAPPPENADPACLAALIAEERNPALLALEAAARERGAPFLWDDDEVSVGYGPGAITWPARALPAPEAVDWGRVRGVPLALVTGTNGKSTTVRMAAAILAAAGLRAGLTSTDWIRVGDEIIDRGDYSGPGGARALLRDPRVEAVVLEVARGGMLRRGLGVERADAAMVTNVAADHLGDYGILTVDDMVEAKFVIRRALGPGAPLVLNADDARCLAKGLALDRPVTWITLDGAHADVRAHVEAGGTAWCLDGDRLVRRRGAEAFAVARVEDLPAAMGGAARHNLHNALGAAALCHALGVPDAAIGAGLARFRGDASDNPGRANLFEGRGVRVLVDFAHNAHGMNAIAATVRALGGERVVLLMGQAGDRPDADIAALVRAAVATGPHRLLACDLPGYERGRAPGEVPAVIRAAAMDAGLAADRIEHFSCPLEGTRAALGDARPGDVLVLLALTQRDEVIDLVRAHLEG